MSFYGLFSELVFECWKWKSSAMFFWISALNPLVTRSTKSNMQFRGNGESMTDEPLLFRCYFWTSAAQTSNKWNEIIIISFCVPKAMRFFFFCFFVFSRPLTSCLHKWLWGVLRLAFWVLHMVVYITSSYPWEQQQSDKGCARQQYVACWKKRWR